MDDLIILKQQLYKCFAKKRCMILEESKLIDPLDAERKALLFNTLKDPKQLKLLYRGTDHEFSVTAFHNKCDNIPNTLTVVKTEFNKTIAAFTKYPWAQEGGYVSDSKK